MSNVPKSERKESGFQVVDTAIAIYRKTLDICMRMPNRYTYLVLLPILNLAGELQDNVKRANSIIPNVKAPNPVDVSKRREYFVTAYSSLQALITRLNFFLDCPETLRVGGKKKYGITSSELLELSGMLRREFTLIKGAIEGDAKRFRM